MYAGLFLETTLEGLAGTAIAASDRPAVTDGNRSADNPKDKRALGEPGILA
jgi:hypothetical protein